MKQKKKGMENVGLEQKGNERGKEGETGEREKTLKEIDVIPGNSFEPALKQL